MKEKRSWQVKRFESILKSNGFKYHKDKAARLRSGDQLSGGLKDINLKIYLLPDGYHVTSLGWNRTFTCCYEMLGRLAFNQSININC